MPRVQQVSRRINGMICDNMPFQPGNQEAKKANKAKPFRDALRLEAAAAEQGQQCIAPKGSLRWNARQLLERGDPIAIREVADRLDGKVPQAIVGDDESDPIRYAISDEPMGADEWNAKHITKD
jgi:hypothetical protein